MISFIVALAHEARDPEFEIPDAQSRIRGHAARALEMVASPSIVPIGCTDRPGIWAWLAPQSKKTEIFGSIR
jgi:hypothetical protein